MSSTESSRAFGELPIENALPSGDPRDNERALASALETGDESDALVLFERMGRAGIEFSCRCFMLAITEGMERASAAFARAGFHLAATDEPAVQALIERDGSMRGLSMFMKEYRYCKAQRTYYLPVVESDASVGPVRALLAEGLLPRRDQEELLTLSIRHGKPALARVLLDGGAQLAPSIREAVPEDLRGGMSDFVELGQRDRWVEFATPLLSIEVLRIVLEQVGDAICPMKRAWFSAYGRTPDFACKLAMIALHSDGAHCEDIEAALSTVAADSQLDAVHAMCAWDNVSVGVLEAAHVAACAAGAVEAAAVLLAAKRERAAESLLAPLEL